MKRTNIQYLLQPNYKGYILTAGHDEARGTIKEAMSKCVRFFQYQNNLGKEKGIEPSESYLNQEYALYKIALVKTYTVKDLINANI